GLVLLQVSLSFVLLVGVCLLVESARKVRAADTGFATNGVWKTGIDLSSAGYDRQRSNSFQDELMDRLLAQGGVVSATFTRIPPFSYAGYSLAPIAVDGDRTPPDDLPTVAYFEIGPSYFATLGIPLLAGREFMRTDDESAPPVAIVNKAIADRYWPGQDPIGRRMQVKGRSMQVVGCAKMSKYVSLTEQSKLFFYVPMRQNAAGQVLLIRTSLGAEALRKTLDREIHLLDANLAPGEVITMQEQVDRKSFSQRSAVRMLGLFGGLALLLASVGLYGVMSYAVSQSRRELGLRMALGAAASDVLRLVMSRGLALTAAGVLLGAGAAFFLARLIGNLLYRVSPHDPTAFAAALVVMAIASTLACLLPALRAMRTDPAQALRE